MRGSRLRERFAAGGPAFAGWCAIGNPYSAELLGHSGLDVVVVDLQHGPYYLDAAVPMLQALSSTGAMPMARCSGLDFAEINKLLDAGAYGIICPMIDSAAQAAELVAATRYPPAGRRSYGPTRGFLYGGADYFQHADRTITTLAMIETPGAVDALDDICAVDGLDGVFIGPSDLSLALGAAPVPRWDAEPLAGAIDRILAAARRHRKMAGIFCLDPSFARTMQAKGFDLLVVAMDSLLVRGGAEARLQALTERPKT